MSDDNIIDRKDLFKKAVVIPSIDRIKVTIMVSKHYENGYHYSLLSENWKKLSRVHKHEPQEYGLYHAFKAKDGEEYFHRIKTWKLYLGYDYKEEAIKDVKAPPRKLKVNGKLYWYQGYTVVFKHWSYRITGWNKKARILKSNNYLSVELNDVLQDYPDRSPYRLIREVIEFLVKEKVIKFNPEKLNRKTIRNKAYKLMSKVHPSETEVAFDFNSYYSALFSSAFQRLAELKDFNAFETTLYLNNSYLKAKRWKLKLYNKSQKDRIDNWISSNRHRFAQQNYKYMLSQVPNEIKSTVCSDDVYRLEITLGSNKLNEYDSRELLKKKPAEMISYLENALSIGITKFFDNFDYKTKKEIIEEIKASIENDIQEQYGNTTKRNHKKIIKALFCQYLPADQQRRAG